MAKKRMPINGIFGIFKEYFIFTQSNYIQIFFNKTKFVRLVPFNYIFSKIFSFISLKMWILCPKKHKNEKISVRLF